MGVPLYYPPADRKVQNYVGRYPGRSISPNILVLHTMEVDGWPGYSNGGTAPHLSLRVYRNADGSLKSYAWRQHFPFNRSARALKNLRGGIETNNSTQGVIQVELAGTCGWAKNVNPKWCDADVVKKIGKPLIDFLVFCNKELGIQLVSPYPFVAYNAPKRRMSYSEWLKFKGICGHQHVPENDHVDPGTIPIAWLIAEAKKIINDGTPVHETPKPQLPVVEYVPKPIQVNGRFDKNTIKLTQWITGLRGKEIDGVWGPISKKALQKWLFVTRDEVIGPDTVKALQKRVGVPVSRRDGIWYLETTKYLQVYLNKRVAAL